MRRKRIKSIHKVQSSGNFYVNGEFVGVFTNRYTYNEDLLKSPVRILGKSIYAYLQAIRHVTCKVKYLVK